MHYIIIFDSFRQHLERYIEKLPLDSEKKALKVIRLCEKYGFPEQSKYFVHSSIQKNCLLCVNNYKVIEVLFPVSKLCSVINKEIKNDFII